MVKMLWRSRLGASPHARVLTLLPIGNAHRFRFGNFVPNGEPHGKSVGIRTLCREAVRYGQVTYAKVATTVAE